MSSPTIPSPRRGELWFADVPGDKRRPVLVLTRDPLGRHLRSVICAPVTSTIRLLHTEVVIGIEQGLAHESVANCDNTFLLPRHRLVKKLGRATEDQMTAVCRAVALAIGCT